MRATKRAGALERAAAWLGCAALLSSIGACAKPEPVPFVDAGGAEGGVSSRDDGLGRGGDAGAEKEGEAVVCEANGRPVVCQDAECERQCFLLRMFDCPTCPPPPPNGKGLYVISANDSNYCLRVNDQPRFCPEGFVNTDYDGVRLRLRDLQDAGGGADAFEVPVQVGALGPGGAWQFARLLRVSSEQTELAVEYQILDQPGTVVARGDGLRPLRFGLPYMGGMGSRFELKIEPVAREHNRPYDSPDTPDWLKRYAVSYRFVGPEPNPWHDQCTVEGGAPPSSFLGGTAVDGVTGAAAEDGAVTTVACRSGAVDTCLAWGYTPWAEKAGPHAPRAFAACLQAKRAAYFVGFGDYNSYTVNRTLIAKKDYFKIGEPQSLLRPEALWGPGGAECLNWANLRVAGMAERLPYEGLLPPCKGTTLSPDWPLATGAVGAP